jgi:hypothetical protein
MVVRASCAPTSTASSPSTASRARHRLLGLPPRRPKVLEAMQEALELPRGALALTWRACARSATCRPPRCCWCSARRWHHRPPAGELGHAAGDGAGLLLRAGAAALVSRRRRRDVSRRRPRTFLSRARRERSRRASRRAALSRATRGVLAPAAASRRSAGHYPVMVALHAAFLAAAPLEVLLLAGRSCRGSAGRCSPSSPPSMALRYWAIATLGDRWNTRVWSCPARRGGRRPVPLPAPPQLPGRRRRDLALPLVHTAWVTALVFSAPTRRSAAPSHPRGGGARRATATGTAPKRRRSRRRRCGALGSSGPAPALTGAPRSSPASPRWRRAPRLRTARWPRGCAWSRTSARLDPPADPGGRGGEPLPGRARRGRRGRDRHRRGPGRGVARRSPRNAARRPEARWMRADRGAASGARLAPRIAHPPRVTRRPRRGPRRAAAHARGETHGLRFVDRRERATFLELARDRGARRARRGGWPRSGSAGERVALVYPTGPGFFDAFFGTLLAGAVPVPLYPPVRLGRLAEYHRRTAAMIAAAGARWCSPTAGAALVGEGGGARPAAARRLHPRRAPRGGRRRRPTGPSPTTSRWCSSPPAPRRAQAGGA